MNEHIVERHFGIIVKVSIRYWRALPPQIASFYDLEDMISDICLHVVKVTHRYNPKRAKDSTFVYNVAKNRCSKILAHYKVQKRFTPVLLSEEAMFQEQKSDASMRLMESLQGFERVLQFSEDSAQFYFERFFAYRNVKKYCAPRPEVLESIKKQMRIQHVSYEDVLAVLKAV